MSHKRQQRRQGVQPHAEGARHVGAAHAQHDDPDRLQQELNQDADHHQGGNHILQ
jgi:hypothetical protein